ncbi:MAG: response regulator, partial [Cocleimonas sp.]|nr:response regulator [Cocleimonas sp.]
LIVDDEPDIHKLTKISLRGLKYNQKKTKFLFAHSGEEAVATMKAHPEIAVVLLDVVMEQSDAGLIACQRIRKELNNPFVRILLRTGQPGSAPEKQTIDDYDIDGYLLKTEITTTRLYSSVRTALKAWDELLQLERHQQLLRTLHQGFISLHSFDDLDVTLERILETTLGLCPSPLAILHLETFEQGADPHSVRVHLSADSADDSEAEVAKISQAINQQFGRLSEQQPTAFAEGYLVPITLHRELGYGWLYLKNDHIDRFITDALPLLAGHAANALYANVAQRLLADREQPIYDTMMI